MNIALSKLQQLEFEARIFISLGIVAFICALSFLGGADSQPTVVRVAYAFGFSGQAALTISYTFGATIMALISLLRMWAGSVLTPTRVMAFKVQVTALKTSGPYRIVRNPIYLADFMAMCVFALCLPPIALLMPVLFYVHYRNLISFEEESFNKSFALSVEEYRSNTPRFLPSLKSLTYVREALREFTISREGFRHNALFVLFVPGFAVAAVTHAFIHVILIGLPAVIDWAIIHTKIGRAK